MFVCQSFHGLVRTVRNADIILITSGTAISEFLDPDAEAIQGSECARAEDAVNIVLFALRNGVERLAQLDQLRNLLLDFTHDLLANLARLFGLEFGETGVVHQCVQLLLDLLVVLKLLPLFRLRQIND